MNKPRSSQRTVLITGCSDGSMGSALALAFHRAGGYRVFASARNSSKLSAVRDAGISTLVLDITSPESIAAAVTEVSSRTGGSLDVLVNNAAGGYSMPVLDMDIHRAEGLFRQNVWPLVTVTRAFLPLLRSSGNGGTVVNHTSTAALLALPFQGAYAASKAAAASLTEAMRLELAPLGIRVVALVTGSVKTTFYQNNPAEELPPDSIYVIPDGSDGGDENDAPKKKVEEVIAALGERHEGRAMDAAAWAEGVVGQLGRREPSHWIWGGYGAQMLRVATLLPVGTLDGTVKKLSGLDAVEREIREGGTGGRR